MSLPHHCLAHRIIFILGQKDGSILPHIVAQIHYLKWPNLQAPSHPGPMINLVKDVRNEVLSLKKDECKIVVHCSEGSGRSGTFIALYRLMETIDQRFEGQSLLKSTLPTTTEQMVTDAIDIFETVLSLRSQRMQMVSYDKIV